MRRGPMTQRMGRLCSASCFMDDSNVEVFQMVDGLGRRIPNLSDGVQGAMTRNPRVRPWAPRPAIQVAAPDCFVSPSLIRSTVTESRRRAATMRATAVQQRAPGANGSRVGCRREERLQMPMLTPARDGCSRRGF